MILDLLLGEALESVLVTDADLHIVLSHTDVKALAQRQQSRMNAVVQFEIFGKPANQRIIKWGDEGDRQPFFEESLGIDVVLAQRGRLPREVCTLEACNYRTRNFCHWCTDGSHWNSRGRPGSSSHPAINSDTPNGRTPLNQSIQQLIPLNWPTYPDCVYSCMTAASFVTN